MAPPSLACFRLRAQACMQQRHAAGLCPALLRSPLLGRACGRAGFAGHAPAARRLPAARSVSQEAAGPPQQLPSVAYGQVVSAEANFVRVNISGLAETDYSTGSSSSSQLQDRQASHAHASTSSSSSSSSPMPTQPQQQQQPPPRRQLLCTVRALLRKMGQRVLVGDAVRVAGIDWQEGRGVVEAIGPRSSELADPAIANVSHVLLLFGLTQPPFEPAQVSRFLVSVGASGLPVTLALNKCDLLPASEVTSRLQQVAGWGYEAVAVSCETGQGLQQVSDRLAGAVSVVAGPSGAGKSSLINALRLGRHKPGAAAAGEAAAAAAAAGPIRLFPAAEQWQQQQGTQPDQPENSSSSDGGDSCSSSWEEADDEGPWSASSSSSGSSSSSNGNSSSRQQQPEFLAVGEMSKIGRGKHTTRTVTLIELPCGGLMADTPGFNQPTLDRVASGHLARLFPEFAAAMDAAGGCRFGDCMHLAEPGCVVTAGGFERYDHYLKFLAEIKAREEFDVRVMQAAKQRREGSLKLVSGRGGEARYEVRLDTKKHRNTSRRRIKQNLWEQSEQQ